MTGAASDTAMHHPTSHQAREPLHVAPSLVPVVQKTPPLPEETNQALIRLGVILRRIHLRVEREKEAKQLQWTNKQNVCSTNTKTP